MSWTTFFIIFAVCVGTIMLFRIVPLLALQNKELSPNVQATLGFIPVAAFAALVANELCTPGAFSQGIWPALLPFIASVPVLAVAIKTKSLIWSIVVGIAAYALLMLIA